MMRLFNLISLVLISTVLACHSHSPAQNQPAGVVCGDNHVGGSESCDDGNLVDDDGCSHDCVIESAVTPPNQNCNDPQDPNCTTSQSVWVMGYYVGYHSSLQSPSEVDYSAMTHIMVGAVEPKMDASNHYDGSFDTSFIINDVDGPAWAHETVNLAHAAGIKAILMLGGDGYVDGFRATEDPTIRAQFVSNLKTIVEDYDFDGVDIDWEPLDIATDGPVIIALMQDLHAAMPDIIYTNPTGGNNANFNEMTNPFYGTLSQYFDRMNMMSYGMLWCGGGWESWHSSALFGETGTTPTSIDNSTQALVMAGVPPSKIGIGVGFYGYAYEKGYWDALAPGGFAHLGAPYVTGPNQSMEDGVWWVRFSDNDVSYSNIMQYYYEESAYRWDDVAKVPYLSFETPKVVPVPSWASASPVTTTYVTYDNEQSIAEKGAYVRNNGLGGVIIWTISEGYLGNWKLTGEVDPLMKAVKTAFLSQ